MYIACVHVQPHIGCIDKYNTHSDVIVERHTRIYNVQIVCCFFFSGSSLMHGMTQLLMPTTPPCPAFTEGVTLQ